MSRKKLNLTGQKFGRWIVLEEAEPRVYASGRKRRYWLCRCSCEKETEITVSQDNLCSGNTRSCGCYNRKRTSEVNKTIIGSDRPNWKGGTSQTKDGKRDCTLRRKFGITLEEYNETWEFQEGLCAICGEPEIERTSKGVVKHLAVDHDHKTGEVRGLLCGRCNLALGFVDDDIFLLSKAMAYLTRVLNRRGGIN